MLFFGVIGSPTDNTELARLTHLVHQRDAFFAGYRVIGLVFSLSLLLLNIALKDNIKPHSELVANYLHGIGSVWATIVIASTFVFLVSLSSLSDSIETNAEQSIVVLQTIDIVVNALGGGIEILGAIWVFLVSFAGLKYQQNAKLTHMFGLVVAIAGVLTLLSGFSMLEKHPLFEVSTAIFGLGQIVWFVLIGVQFLRKPQ